MPIDPPRSIVLLSGGMNSAVMAYDLIDLSKAEIIDCMIFDHYQTNADEIDYASRICQKQNLPFSTWSFEPSQTIGLPAVPTFPGKVRVMEDSDAPTPPKLLFSHMLNMAAHRAGQLKAGAVYIGLLKAESPVDWEALDRFWMAALEFAGVENVALQAPLWDSTKDSLFNDAAELNRVVEILRDTLSCLNGNDQLRHEWGYGCGSCDGCVRRWRGWDLYMESRKKK